MNGHPFSCDCSNRNSNFLGSGTLAWRNERHRRVTRFIRAVYSPKRSMLKE